MRVGNQFLDAYMEYVEDTEPPRIFHLWSAISAIGACLGRRAWFNFGDFPTFPNEYILLVGPPAVRKSTTLSITRRLLGPYTNIRFAPDDTGGARQGLIAAMQGFSLTPEDEAIKNALNGSYLNDQILEQLAQAEITIGDEHTLYVSASEFNTFIGINSTDMITFLIRMWDGDEYKYKLKNEERVLQNALLSIVGGTTPTSLAKSLPPDTIGGGFMSRVVLVYGNQKYKRLARPKNLDRGIAEFLSLAYKYANTQIKGPFDESPVARKALDDLYDYQVDINDPRFIYYIERRHTHLIKLIMCLAAAEQRMQIELRDVEIAHSILRMTESGMVDALGEFGLSELGAAKQKLLEFIQHMSPAPITMTIIQAVMKRDMKQVDLINSLIDLENAGKIKSVTTNEGKAFIYYDDKALMRAKIEKLLATEIADGPSNVVEIEPELRRG